MKKALAAMLLLSPLLAAPVMAQTHAPAANSQQNKMASCNHDAGDKKGDDRKAFMKQCLSSAPAPMAKAPTQQEKMKMCNQSAGDKKGDDRKAFMKQCLSNKPSA